jgi:hypothetical protein
MGEPGRWRLETAEVSALASTANEARTDINNTTKQKALMEGYFVGILLCSLHSILFLLCSLHSILFLHWPQVPMKHVLISTAQ